MKKMTVIWSPQSLNHFHNWILYIARDSWQSANKERTKILSAIRRLPQFPYSGRIVPEFDLAHVREIVKKPIRIIYRISGSQIEIFAFCHERQLLDDRLFD